MTATLDAGSGLIAPGGDALIAVTQTPDPGWHTYWINPGETGFAADIDLTLPAGLKAGSTLWPTPRRLVYDGVVNYGFDQPVTAWVRVHNNSHLPARSVVPVAVHLESLVCQDTCEPVSFDLKTRLKIDPSAPAPAMPPSVPTAISAPASYALSGRTLRLGFSLPGDVALRNDFLHPQGAYVFSEDESLIAPAAAQTINAGPQGFTITLPSSASLLPDQATLVIAFPDGHAARLIAHKGSLPAGISVPTSQGRANAISTPMIWAVILAFLGGLVLNLMPCVFPILSMKLLALTRAGHHHALARREALIYGLGALLSFVGLSLMLDAARGLGEVVGWGFQLQSPFVTAALSLLMLLVGLNLSGLFEIGGSLQAAAGNQTLGRHPNLAAFMTGVLAVVVAAPCSAPFMATATGVALARGGWASIAIFTALGLGFAAPFVALTFGLTWMPSLAKRIPRPGPWMDRLRHLLAVPMYLAAVWMGWVFWQQAGPAGLGLLIVGTTLIAAALVVHRLPKTLRAACAVIGLALITGSALQTPAAPFMTANAGQTPFSEDRLVALRAKGQPVLVDMTAAWCLTCKVNERIALSDKRVLAAMQAQHIVYMVGDWTDRNAQITRYLTQFGRSGVPLYVYYAPGKNPQLLPQLLTPDIVLKTLKTGN